MEANYKGWGSSDFQVVHLYLQNKIEKIGNNPQAENSESDIHVSVSVMLLGVSLQHYHGTKSGCKKYM